jgi:hypothetical protein
MCSNIRPRRLSLEVSDLTQIGLRNRRLRICATVNSIVFEEKINCDSVLRQAALLAKAKDIKPR